jgi:hypothetical protein
MTLLPFSEYKPDQSSYMQSSTQYLNNVLPRADGYGPFPSFNALTSALPAACRGMIFARNSDGSVTIFAGTSTRLFKLSNTDLTWVPVSKVIALTSISNASPAVFTLVAHGLSIGDAIVLSTSGGLPTGLTVGTVYYVITAGFSADVFRVSATLGGSAINTSSAGSGTHSFTGQYTALPTADQWQFVQFNQYVIAVHLSTAPQVYDLTTSTAFADLGGSPPQARYVAIVNRFVVLSGLGTSTPYRIQWSGLGATTTWTQGTNNSDYQDLPDGGIVRGVAGGEYGVVFQDGSIRRMIYVPGSVVTFQFDRISEDKGVYAPLSVTRAGERIFYVGSDGIKMLAPGSLPQAIGKERVDRTFFAEFDTSTLRMCIGVSDPENSRWVLAYKSSGGAAGTFDKILCYDWALDKWSSITTSGEYIASLAAPGITLENLDSINASIDALSGSLDDISTGAFPALAVVSTSHIVGFYSGAAIEATLDTPEQANDGTRIRVKGFRPVTDAGTCYGSVGGRERQQDSVAYSTEQALNTRGLVPANVSTRLARGRMRIPSGTTWTFATGIEPVVIPEGKR